MGAAHGHVTVNITAVSLRYYCGITAVSLRPLLISCTEHASRYAEHQAVLRRDRAEVDLSSRGRASARLQASQVVPTELIAHGTPQALANPLGHCLGRPMATVWDGPCQRLAQLFLLLLA